GSGYPVTERNDAPIRAFREEVLDFLGGQLVDVRSPQEYTGKPPTCPTTRRRAPCAAGTSPPRTPCPGPAPPPRTAVSARAPSSRRSTPASSASIPHSR